MFLCPTINISVSSKVILSSNSVCKADKPSFISCSEHILKTLQVLFLMNAGTGTDISSLVNSVIYILIFASFWQEQSKIKSPLTSLMNVTLPTVSTALVHHSQFFKCSICLEQIIANRKNSQYRTSLQGCNEFLGVTFVFFC